MLIEAKKNVSVGKFILVADSEGSVYVVKSNDSCGLISGFDKKEIGKDKIKKHDVTPSFLECIDSIFGSENNGSIKVKMYGDEGVLVEYNISVERIINNIGKNN